MTDRTLTTLAIVALAAALVGAALGLASERREVDPTAFVASKQKLRLGNNKRGRAVIRFYRMAPGDVRKRRVRISNRRGPARMKLEAAKVKGTAGPNGGALADVLRIRVRRLRVTRRKTRPGRVIYSGPLNEMERYKLGRYKARSARQFRFKVRLPDHGVPPSARGGDNAYQGAKATVTFRWRARGSR